MLTCCVIWCKQSCKRKPDPSYTFNTNVTMHMFPKNKEKRKMWIDIIGEHNIIFTKKSLTICSLHFDVKWFNKSTNITVLLEGAMPTGELLACKMCLITGVKFFSLKQYNLERAYEQLTGISAHSMPLLKKLCPECAQRLFNFKRLRNKTLEVHSLLSQLVMFGISINMKSIRSIDRKQKEVASDLEPIVFKPNKCDAYIIEDIEDDAYMDNDYEENKRIIREIEEHTEKMFGDTDTHIQENIKPSDHTMDDDIDYIDTTDYSSDEELPIKKHKIDKQIITKESEYNYDENNENTKLYKYPNVKDNEKEDQSSNNDLSLNKHEVNKLKINGEYYKKNDLAERVVKGDVNREAGDNIRKKDDVTFREQKLLKYIKQVRERQEMWSFNNSVFKCVDCSKGFLDEKAYTNHVMENHKHMNEISFNNQKNSLMSNLKVVKLEPKEFNHIIEDTTQVYRNQEFDDNEEIIMDVQKKEVLDIDTEGSYIESEAESDMNIKTEYLDANYSSNEEVPYKRKYIEELHLKEDIHDWDYGYGE